MGCLQTDEAKLQLKEEKKKLSTQERTMRDLVVENEALRKELQRVKSVPIPHISSFLLIIAPIVSHNSTIALRQLLSQSAARLSSIQEDTLSVALASAPFALTSPPTARVLPAVQEAVTSPPQISSQQIMQQKTRQQGSCLCSFPLCALLLVFSFSVV